MYNIKLEIFKPISKKTVVVKRNINQEDSYVSFETNIGINRYKVNLNTTTEIKYGDKISINKYELEKIKNKYNNPSSFNYARYSKSKGIKYECNVSSFTTLKHSNRFTYKLKNFKDNIIESINQEYYEISDVVSSLVFGENSFDDKTLDTFNKYGIIQLFVISGMHFQIIINGLKKIKKKYIKNIIITLYAMIIGFSTSITRVYCMYIAKFFQIKSYDSLKILVIINFLLNPYKILTLGFILSYGISYLYIHSPNLDKIKNVISFNKIIMLVTLPILINANYTINIILPYILYVYEKLIKYLVMVSFIFIFGFIFDLNIIINITQSIILASIDIFEFLLKINSFFILPHRHISQTLSLLYYYYLYKKKIKYCILILLLTTLTININQMYLIDVSQGDSILIQINKKNILIDTGDEYGGSEVVEYLDYMGINKIDYLILSHKHKDHYGGIKEILENKDVENIIVNENDDYPNEKLEETNVIKLSESIEFMENFYIYVPEEKSDNPNNNSLIIKVCINNKWYLLMGDAEKEEEEKFLEEYPNQENVDYIKLGHHGSKTSTTQELLDKTKPKKVFISSGKNNLYGHPSKETIQLLEKNKIEYENTQDVGLIKMK